MIILRLKPKGWSPFKHNLSPPICSIAKHLSRASSVCVCACACVLACVCVCFFACVYALFTVSGSHGVCAGFGTQFLSSMHDVQGLWRVDGMYCIAWASLELLSSVSGEWLPSAVNNAMSGVGGRGSRYCLMINTAFTQSNCTQQHNNI